MPVELKIENIPQELKELNQWVCWRLEDIEDAVTGEKRKAKIPRQPNGGARARSNDKSTWTSFEAALKAVKRYDGLEFMVSADDPYVVIDLDNCVTNDNTPNAWAQKIINSINTYTEFSQSGKGIHIIARGNKPGPRCRINSSPNFEIYDHGRPFVITGNHITGTPLTIEPTANELVELYNEIFKETIEPKIKPEAKKHIASGNPVTLSDWELVEKAKAAKNGSQFSKLWYGDASDYNNDLSAASLALCNILSFWTQDDTERIDRLFRQSGLMRDKWDSKRPGGTWGSLTIKRALADPHEVFSPAKQSANVKRLDKAIAESTVKVNTKTDVRVRTKTDTRKPDIAFIDDSDITEISNNNKDNDDSNNNNGILDFEVEDLIPANTFLDSYVNYASELTDAPREFHLAVALTITAAALGNRIYINVWGQHVYPNLWMILLAPSGFYRKSTAINIGLKALKGQCDEVVLPDDFTREKLIETLQERPFGIIPVYEFGELLARLTRDYNLGTKEFLTNIYDGHSYTRATKRERVNITNPAVSILAASTIDWVHDRITEGDIRGGFLARYLFWPSIEKNGWKGISPPIDTHIMDELQTYLGQISLITEGYVVFPESIIELYNNWVFCHEEEVNNKKLPAEMQGFYTRLSTYVLKLAMLYQVVLEIHEPISIGNDAMSYAIQVAEYLKTKLVQVVEDELVTTRDARELKLIKDLVKRDPGITKSRLLKNSHMIAKRLDDLLTTLLESNQIVVQVNETMSKPKQMFYLSETTTDEEKVRK